MSHTQTKIAQNISANAAARYWQATLARDSRADGSFVLAVRSTHIYCRPSCPARRPLRRNVTFFRTREEAEKQGYRPCLRCRPNEIAGPVALVQRAASQLAESSEESMRLGVLARRSEEHTSELQSHLNLVCRLLLEKKKDKVYRRS